MYAENMVQAAETVRWRAVMESLCDRFETTNLWQQHHVTRAVEGHQARRAFRECIMLRVDLPHLTSSELENVRQHANSPRDGRQQR